MLLEKYIASMPKDVRIEFEFDIIIVLSALLTTASRQNYTYPPMLLPFSNFINVNVGPNVKSSSVNNLHKIQ